MAGTTSKGLRYPTSGDNPAVHTDIYNLATDVDTELDDYVLKSAPNFTSDVTLSATRTLIFEGATVDSYETTLQVEDPTADRTITLPDANGTVALVSDIPTSTDELPEGSTNKYFSDSLGFPIFRNCGVRRTTENWLT